MDALFSTPYYEYPHQNAEMLYVLPAGNPMIHFKDSNFYNPDEGPGNGIDILLFGFYLGFAMVKVSPLYFYSISCFWGHVPVMQKCHC